MIGDVLRTIFLGLSLLVSTVALFYTWYTARQRASQQELEKLRERVLEVDARRATAVGELRDRVTRVEAEVENLPNHSQMSHLTTTIQEVKGDVTGMRDMLNMVFARVERVDNYLMNEVKRG